MERGLQKEEKRGEMGHSAGIQGENKGLLEHNFFQSVRLIYSRRAEGKDQREGNMKSLQG